MLGNIYKAAILAAVIVILTGYDYNSESDHKARASQPAKMAVWLAYWDLESGEHDLAEMGSNLAQISYFGAYFDQDDRVFLPKEVSDKQRQIKKKRPAETYLTFVNDRRNCEGKTALKDTEVLGRVFSNKESMNAHINEIIALTLQGGFDGIEIDYERIWKDPEISQAFLKFVGKLYTEARKSNLRLRLVLEPSTPFSAIEFPKGPEYVVMCYNLYGLHSDPGPKANKEFIHKTLIRMKVLPGEISAAFSAGGCRWGDNGTKSFLTEDEAKNLAQAHNAAVRRDEESQCLVFEYKDGEISYQVWYADVMTLNHWIAIAKEHGVNNISLWRLGGNVDIYNIG
ncbi:hypothetical protein SDC9_99578 [bioreactor metagenome]|uniref:GH18 domain-containing protein n=1 Tax=bioreactor metagenome TaxID=1076179 RepID=A0A645AHY6_9ZZZZ